MSAMNATETYKLLAAGIAAVSALTIGVYQYLCLRYADEAESKDQQIAELQNRVEELTTLNEQMKRVLVKPPSRPPSPASSVFDEDEDDDSAGSSTSLGEPRSAPISPRPTRKSTLRFIQGLKMTKLSRSRTTEK